MAYTTPQRRSNIDVNPATAAGMSIMGLGTHKNTLN